MVTVTTYQSTGRLSSPGQIVTVSFGFTLEWMNLNMLTRPADWRGAATVNGVNRFESGKFWHKNAD